LPLATTQNLGYKIHQARLLEKFRSQVVLSISGSKVMAKKPQVALYKKCGFLAITFQPEILDGQS